LPVVKESLALIQQGRLGTVTSFEANEHLHPEHGGFLRRDWRRHCEFAGSYVLDKCCHDLDLLNAVAGARPRRIASVVASRIFTRAHAHLDTPPRYRSWPTRWESGERIFDSDADTADVQTILLEYADGVLGTFHRTATSILRDGPGSSPAWRRRWTSTSMAHGSCCIRRVMAPTVTSVASTAAACATTLTSIR
jgi:predicted dehydrogenase